MHNTSDQRKKWGYKKNLIALFLLLLFITLSVGIYESKYGNQINKNEAEVSVDKIFKDVKDQYNQAEKSGVIIIKKDDNTSLIPNKKKLDDLIVIDTALNKKGNTGVYVRNKDNIGTVASNVIQSNYSRPSSGGYVENISIANNTNDRFETEKNKLVGNINNNLTNGGGSITLNPSTNDNNSNNPTPTTPPTNNGTIDETPVVNIPKEDAEDGIVDEDDNNTETDEDNNEDNNIDKYAGFQKVYLANDSVSCRTYRNGGCISNFTNADVYIEEGITLINSPFSVGDKSVCIKTSSTSYFQVMVTPAYVGTKFLVEYNGRTLNIKPDDFTSVLDGCKNPISIN